MGLARCLFPLNRLELRPKPSVKECTPNRVPQGREAEIPFGGDRTGGLGGSRWVRLAGKDEHVAAEAGEWGAQSSSPPAPTPGPQSLGLQRSEAMRVGLGRGGWGVRRRKKMGGRAL